MQSSRGALTSLILLWIVLCVVVPRAAQTLGATLSPAPGKVEFEAALNPFLAIRTLSMALAGSDLAHYVEFQWQAERFRYDMVQKLNQVHIDEIKFENDRAQRVSRSHWQEFPSFEYRPPSIRDAIRPYWLSIVSLFGWSILIVFLFARLRPVLVK